MSNHVSSAAESTESDSLPLAVVRQQSIPVVAIGAVEFLSVDSVEATSVATQLADGQVVVIHRKLSELSAIGIYDSTLVRQRSVPIAEVVGRSVSFVAVFGDSLLLADRPSQTLIVWSPSGRTRVASLPRVQDVSRLWQKTAIDSRGRLIYRGEFVRIRPTRKPGDPPPKMPEQPDSFPLVRVDLDKRQTDTIAVLKHEQGLRIPTTRDGLLPGQAAYIIHPLPVIDDWALAADGSVAVVRGRDYSVGWIGLDGRADASVKLPFAWRKISDEDKQRIVDSVRASFLPPPTASDQPPRIVDSPRLRRPPPVQEVVPKNQIPDYYPALRDYLAGVVADRDGNVWILPATSDNAGDGLVYDLVRRGTGVRQRVRLPKGATIAGFGRHGVVFLHIPLGSKLALGRARVRL